MTNLHKILKQLRLENNLSQKDLSQILGVNHRTICNWEAARNEPDLSMLVKIANSFNVTTDYLLDSEDYHI